MESSKQLRPISDSPWVAGIVPGAACITEQINLDPTTGLATSATYYQARFHFPHGVIPNQDVYPTFQRPSAPNVVLKLIPHAVNTTWFPAWIINGYTVYSLPAEAPAAGPCNGDGQPTIPTAPGTPDGGPGEVPIPGGTVNPVRPSLVTTLLLNASSTELAALKAALGAV